MNTEEFKDLNISQKPDDGANDSAVNVQFEEQVSKKRGRPKGAKNKVKQDSDPSGNPASNSSNETDFYARISEQMQSAPVTNTPQTNQPVQLSSLLTGYMLIIICDAFIPRLVAKFMKIKSHKHLKLDKKEREELQPIADEAAKKIFANVDPLTGFLICYGAMVFSKAEDNTI